MEAESKNADLHFEPESCEVAIYLLDSSGIGGLTWFSTVTEAVHCIKAGRMAEAYDIDPDRAEEILHRVISAADLKRLEPQLYDLFYPIPKDPGVDLWIGTFQDLMVSEESRPTEIRGHFWDQKKKPSVETTGIPTELASEFSKFLGEELTGSWLLKEERPKQ